MEGTEHTDKHQTTLARDVYVISFVLATTGIQGVLKTKGEGLERWLTVKGTQRSDPRTQVEQLTDTCNSSAGLHGPLHSLVHTHIRTHRHKRIT